MKITNFAKSAGIGGIIVLLTAGASMAAVATASVNVRTGPSTGYRVVDTLRPGEQVAIVDREGSWCAIQKSGPSGWVACNYLSASSTQVYRPSPSVSLSFGFGSRPPVRHNDYWDHRWDRYGRYDNNDRDHNSGNSFGFSFSN